MFTNPRWLFYLFFNFKLQLIWLNIQCSFLSLARSQTADKTVQMRECVGSFITFIVCHANIGISHFALVHAVVHVHVWCSRCENFRANLLYQSLLALLVDVMNLCQTLELKWVANEMEVAHENLFRVCAQRYLIKNSLLSTQRKTSVKWDQRSDPESCPKMFWLLSRVI